MHEYALLQFHFVFQCDFKAETPFLQPFQWYAKTETLRHWLMDLKLKEAQIYSSTR